MSYDVHPLLGFPGVPSLHLVSFRIGWPAGVRVHYRQHRAGSRPQPRLRHWKTMELALEHAETSKLRSGSLIVVPFFAADT